MVETCSPRNWHSGPAEVRSGGVSCSDLLCWDISSSIWTSTALSAPRQSWETSQCPVYRWDPKAQSCASGHLTNPRQRLGPKSRALGSHPGSATSCCSGTMNVAMSMSCLSLLILPACSLLTLRAPPVAHFSLCSPGLAWALGGSWVGCELSPASLERGLGHLLGRGPLMTPGTVFQKKSPQGAGRAWLGVEAVNSEQWLDGYREGKGLQLVEFSSCSTSGTQLALRAGCF